MGRSAPPKRLRMPKTPLSAPLFHATAHETHDGPRVVPPRAEVNGKANPFFRFRNNTSYPGWLLLPAQIRDGLTDPVPVRRHDWVEVPLKGGGPFAYVFAVDAGQGCVSVPGASDPVIIIDPPAN